MALLCNSSVVALTIVILSLLSMVDICHGVARQYGQSKNEIYSFQQSGINRRKVLLTADESNAEVLRELGVDISNEGRELP